MLNFTVGPVQSSESVLKVGGQQIPYFRTEEFSAVMLENERRIKTFARAEEGARAVFLTGSGTASMEASVINFFTGADKLLVVNGGSFGARFVELCNIHEIPHTAIELSVGENVTESMLAAYDGQGYTGFLVNIHETSTGVRYDLDCIAKFCKKNGLFLVVDAISSFLADEIDMQKAGVDALIIGSQKALACAPGISVIVMSQRAVERVMQSNVKCMYLNLKSALTNGERGQTPFTPAVGTLLQIHTRLREIEESGGVETEIARVKALAEDFRRKIQPFPFTFVTKHPSNAVTSLATKGVSAYQIFLTLKDEYGIWICPNGGGLKEKIFRVGHIGALTEKDNDTLIAALYDMQKKGLL